MLDDQTLASPAPAHAGSSLVYDPAPLELWRDIHLSLAATGQTVRPEEMPPFALVRRDAGGRMYAALTGEVVFKALHISHVWVADGMRGYGLGSALLAEAEAYGRRRGAARAHLETFSEDARRLYERRGFAVFGQLARYADERTLYFLEKPLV